jgi:hypothetical protein
MKKRIFGLVIVAAIVLGSGWNISKSDVALSDMALANVEALATGEGAGGSHTLSCGSTGIKMCKATCGIHQVTIEAWGNGSPTTLTCN